MDRRRNVLVVDDDEDIVFAVVDALGEEGYVVKGYTEPWRALEALRRGAEPDIVLLDCLMPGMGGSHVLDALYARSPRVPVLLFSAADRVAFELAPRAAGVVLKPCGVEDLLAAIAAAFSEHEQTPGVVVPQSPGLVRTQPQARPAAVYLQAG